ncbi:MAG: HTTM domain-containing protein, partial [Pirellulales bacterium]|nr:HTTM domain-containing protein [Pirellulales bacterium]
NWNERGHRFAWRMMLRDKNALTHFLIIDNGRQDFLFVPSTLVLTAYQSSRADHHPELIRQTAVELRRFAAETGAWDIEVHALALVSLNGRQPKPMIDPQVDLSRQTRHWFRDDWEADDAGELLETPWNHPPDDWWRLIELPPPFRDHLQNRRPSELQEYLEGLDQSRQEQGLQDPNLVKPRGNPDKYWRLFSAED